MLSFLELVLFNSKGWTLILRYNLTLKLTLSLPNAFYIDLMDKFKLKWSGEYGSHIFDRVSHVFFFYSNSYLFL